MSSKLIQKIQKLAASAERRNQDKLAFRLVAVAREVSASSSRILKAAKGEEIEVESWPDFLSWWNNNRGQNLVYIFIDTYGDDSEQVSKVRSLVDEASAHEKTLHEFYMWLRSSGQGDDSGLPLDEGDSDLPAEEPPMEEDPMREPEEDLDLGDEGAEDTEDELAALAADLDQ